MEKSPSSSTLPKSFFALVQESELPVLVDFYADWCQPCKMVSPVVARIAKDLKGKILTVKINVDQKPQVSGHFNISSIPTIMLFKGGKSVMRLQGAYPYDAMMQEIRKALGT